MKAPVNILLVDDRPEGLVALEAVLKSPEYNLVMAGSGKEALAQVLLHDFALILMDVQMPEMDGLETAAIIKQRERSKNIPIIFMTAINKTDAFVAKGYALGAVDYLLKPFDPHILKSKVNVFVDLYHKGRLLQQQSDALREIEIKSRRQALQELELEGRRRYQNLADAIPQIVFRARQNGEIEYFNQFWLRYTGLSLPESVGLGWRQVVNPEDLKVIDEKWSTAAQSRIGFECECRIRQGQANEERWHLLRAVPEFGALSELICWIGTTTDIHDNKLTEQELVESKRAAELANDTKSRFLANMSHEIRTPLGAILGFSEILMDPACSDKERCESIAAIRRNGEQLSKLVDEILDLSKIEAGKIDVQLSWFPLVEFLNGIKSMMSLTAKEKGLDLVFRVKGKIPAKIFSNASRLQQILLNVIGNAIKFTPKGKVIVSVGYQDDRLQVSVKDSGPGLTAQQIKNLFQPFSQIDSSITRKFGGTGLGLALSQRLATALGGSITVEPCKPGEGCEFVVSVTAGKLEEMAFTDTLELPNVGSIQPPNLHSNTLQNLKVLLVEDSVDNQVLVSRFLGMASAHVDIAANGVEGIRMAIEGDHNIVLMDIQMPELDGYGAISKLRQMGFRKPIIALTAHGMLEEKQRCLAVGANDHLTKPIHRTMLIERVYQLSQS